MFISNSNGKRWSKFEKPSNLQRGGDGSCRREEEAHRSDMMVVGGGDDRQS